MLYAVFNLDHTLIAMKAELSKDERDRDGRDLMIECRHDWKTFEEAEAIAAFATIALNERYIATDAGPCVWPRYDVIKMHQVGDSYPCGKITKISATLKKITTYDAGRGKLEFYRVGQSGSWREGGTWYPTRGHVYKQNPSF